MEPVLVAVCCLAQSCIQCKQKSFRGVLGVLCELLCCMEVPQPLTFWRLCAGWDLYLKRLICV